MTAAVLLELEHRLVTPAELEEVRAGPDAPRPGPSSPTRTPPTLIKAPTHHHAGGDQ